MSSWAEASSEWRQHMIEEFKTYVSWHALTRKEKLRREIAAFSMGPEWGNSCASSSHADLALMTRVTEDGAPLPAAIDRMLAQAGDATS